MEGKQGWWAGPGRVRAGLRSEDLNGRGHPDRGLGMLRFIGERTERLKTRFQLSF